MTTDTPEQPVSATPSFGRNGHDGHKGAPKDPPKRLWHRRPGQKIDDLLLKRHQHSSQRYAPLARLIRQSDQRESLTLAVRALLPDHLAEAVEVVNFRAPSLVLRISNASLATRLRYSLPELTTKLRNLADFHGLTKINVRVVQTSTPSVPESQPRVLPVETAEALANFAKLLQEQSEYRELSETILRLSEHTAAPEGDLGLTTGKEAPTSEMPERPPS